MSWLFIVLVIALAVGYHQWLPTLIVRPRRQQVNLDPRDLGFGFESILLDTPDGLALSALYVPATTAPRGNLVILHGKDSAKEVYLEYLQHLAPFGYNVLLYDARAHGRSGGEFTTFGYHERHDVHLAVARLRYLGGQHLPTGVFGHSMGGAVALQAMAATASDVDFGIVESTFADLGEITHHYARSLTGLPLPRWSVDLLLDRAEKTALFKHRDVSPLTCAALVTQPVLIVHGERDLSIDVDNGRRLYAALASAQKELYIVPGAGHDNVDEVGGDGYWWRLRAFLESVTPVIR